MLFPGRIKFLYSLLFILCVPSFAFAVTCTVNSASQGWEFVVSPVLESEVASFRATFYAEGDFACVYSSLNSSSVKIDSSTNSSDPVYFFDVKGDGSGSARGFLNCGTSSAYLYGVSCLDPSLAPSVNSSLLYGFGLILGVVCVGMILWAALK